MEWLPDPQTLEQSLLYRYPFEAAAHTPSKLTATQLKGRLAGSGDFGRRIFEDCASRLNAGETIFGG